MKKYWMLIYLKRGFIQEPELFTTKQNALVRKKEILKSFNRDYDEI